MPDQAVKVRVGAMELSGTVVAVGRDAARNQAGEGVRLVLTGDRDYVVVLGEAPAAQ